AACGGEGAAEIVAQLQSAPEPALVRLAALEALCAIPSRLRAALEIAARDETAAIRRRAAALAASAGVEDLAPRLAADEDACVRAAVAAARRETPAPARPAPQAAAPAPARPRDAVRPARQGQNDGLHQPRRPAGGGRHAGTGSPSRLARRPHQLPGRLTRG